LGTVGLSMGITADLSIVGKLTIIALMFAGRCGPLTLGLALLRPDPSEMNARGDDLAV
jgi:trk system potassium uptake protein TrkH